MSFKLELICSIIFFPPPQQFSVTQLLPVPMSCDCGKMHTPSFLPTLPSAYTTYITVVIKVTQVGKTEFLTTSFLHVSSESLYNTASTFTYKSKEGQVTSFWVFFFSHLCQQYKALIGN